MSLHSKQNLAKKLRTSKKFRDAFTASRISQILAMQVRVLREKNNLSQAELARELGTSQNAIYRLENPSYGKHSISTLKKVAAFFDVGLVVRFTPISEIMQWTLTMGENTINVPTAKDDVELNRAAEGIDPSRRETDARTGKTPTEASADIGQHPTVQRLLTAALGPSKETWGSLMKALTEQHPKIMREMTRAEIPVSKSIQDLAKAQLELGNSAWTALYDFTSVWAKPVLDLTAAIERRPVAAVVYSAKTSEESDQADPQIIREPEINSGASPSTQNFTGADTVILIDKWRPRHKKHSSRVHGHSGRVKNAWQALKRA